MPGGVGGDPRGSLPAPIPIWGIERQGRLTDDDSGIPPHLLCDRRVTTHRQFEPPRFHPGRGLRRWFICQDKVYDPSIAPGDSGSPVFDIEYGSDVALYGILIAKNGGHYLFSRMANIKLELGTFTAATNVVIPE